MRFTYKNYGKEAEITAYERAPSQVRLHAARERPAVVGARRSDNVQRSKRICVRRLLTATAKYGPPLLVTLTFAGDASDASFANDALRRFQVRLRTQFANPHSLFVPELSPRGRIHFHGFLFNVPMHLGDTRKGRRLISPGTERESRTIYKLWGQGYVDVRQTDGDRRLAYYLAKYVTKGGQQVMFNAMRLVRVSRGFPKELVIRGRLARRIAEKYSVDRKPVREWEGENDFLGKIHKKTYEL